MSADLPQVPTPAPSTGPPTPVHPEVVGDHPEACALVRQWLTETCLDWPGPFRLTVHVGETNPFPPDDREIFRQPGCTIQAGPPSGTVYVTWDVAPGAALVHPTRAEAEVWLSPAAIVEFSMAERSFLLVMLVFVMRRLGWYHVHAASLIDPQGRGWLIAGTSNVGKSTTTALVATRGWQVGTDDIGFLALRDGQVVSLGMRTRIALRPGGVALLGAVGGFAMAQRNKEGYWPEELGGAWAPIIVPQILAFPTLGDQTAITPSSPRETLSSIIKWSNWVLYEEVFAQEYLDVLGKVAQQSRCVNLTLGPDLFQHPDLLQELIT